MALNRFAGREQRAIIRTLVLEVTADYSRVDTVASGFDADIHFGEYIQKDMIAVRVSKDYRAAMVLTTCSAINASTSGMGPPACTDGSSTRQEIPVRCGKRPLIVDDVETMVRAIDGIGLAFVSDERVSTTGGGVSNRRSFQKYTAIAAALSRVWAARVSRV